MAIPSCAKLKLNTSGYAGNDYDFSDCCRACEDGGSFVVSPGSAQRVVLDQSNNGLGESEDSLARSMNRTEPVGQVLAQSQQNVKDETEPALFTAEQQAFIFGMVQQAVEESTETRKNQTMAEILKLYKSLSRLYLDSVEQVTASTE